MKKHLVVILIFFIVAPVWAISVIWSAMIKNENDAIQYRFERVLEERISDFIAETDQELAKIEGQLLVLADLDRQSTRAEAQVGPTDALIVRWLAIDRLTGFSRVLGSVSSLGKDRMVLLRDIYPFADDIVRSAMGEKSQVPVQSVSEVDRKAKTSGYGWHTQFGDDGIRLFFWRWASKDSLVIAELSRQELLKRLISKLPDTKLPFSDAVVLSDEFGQLLHMWGDSKLLENNAHPQASLPLKYPLNVFRMYYFAKDIPNMDFKPHVLTLAIAGSLFFLGGYFFWVHIRTIDDAAQKVSFVNQVSHELKTPLTNIQMYAELLRDTVGEDESAAKKIDIVVSESQRLSRLIKNVLTFSSKHQIYFNPQRQELGALIMKVIDSFRPNLEKKNFVVDVRCRVGQVFIDADLLEQILINLVSNVEKYASDGKYLGIEAYEQDNRLHIRVSDKGKGVPRKFQKKIFKPFVRAQDKTTEGISGTGIGLSLAKDLAQKHGGDLVLVSSSDKGTCFEVII